MKTLTAFIAFTLLGIGISQVDATTLKTKSGFVRYEARLKTMGIGGHAVSAVNKNVIGKIVVSDSGSIEGGLLVPIVNFDSDNSKRDKDVANILKYKEYPAITFEIVDIAKSDIYKILESDSGQVDMKVSLTVAGSSKEYNIVLFFDSIESNMIHFTTGIDAKFSDFGIKPPRLGLVLKTAEDKIYLSGDLIFDIEKEETVQP